MPTNDNPVILQLCLISHTNAGKTTLARTLLGMDVGEIRDAAHVTETADAHTLLATDEGDSLQLWDTPGFGDSVRLAKRLSQAGNPVGWFLTEVWDRARDRPFWLSQRALLAARDNADVVLYLVNASEDPQDSGYVAPEMQILQWLGKPVIVLLNQTGPPKTPNEEHSEIDRWARHMRPFGVVRDVIALDAFARCWVHERVLFDAVGKCVSPDKQAGYARLITAWERRNRTRFDASMQAIAQQIIAAAQDKEAIEDASPFKATLNTLGIGKNASNGARDTAIAAMSERMSRTATKTTAKLLALHGLQGSAAAPINQRLRENFTFNTPLDVKQAGLLGAIASSAATGASADLLSGGLTLGGGMLVGAVIGALGFASAAWGVNKAKGSDHATVQLSEEFLQTLVVAGLLRYLAVAHFGRGRGNYVEGEAPAFWREEVLQAVHLHAGNLPAIWAKAREQAEPDPACAELAAVLSEAALQILRKLYPGTEPAH